MFFLCVSLIIQHESVHFHSSKGTGPTLNVKKKLYGEYWTGDNHSFSVDLLEKLIIELIIYDIQNILFDI